MTRTQTAPNVGGLGLLLNRLSHSLTREFETALRPFGLGPTHLGILTALHRYGALSQTRLAAHIGIEPQQMVNLAAALETDGLIRRTRDPDDRRAWSLELTPAGATRRQQALTVATEHEQRTFAALTSHQQHVLADLLLRLVPAGRFPDLFADINTTELASTAHPVPLPLTSTPAPATGDRREDPYDRPAGSVSSCSDGGGVGPSKAALVT